MNYHDIHEWRRAVDAAGCTVTPITMGRQMMYNATLPGKGTVGLWNVGASFGNLDVPESRPSSTVAEVRK